MTTENQGTAQPAAEEPVAPSGTSDSAGAATPGVQKRIDELTAQKKQFEEALAAEKAEKERLLLAMVEAQRLAMTAPPPQAPEAPKAIPLPEGMDPAYADYFRSLVESKVADAVKQTEARLAPALRENTFTVAQMEIEQASNGLDPAIKQRAHQLYADWQRRGLQGFRPADAVRYAAGELALDPTRRQQGRDALGRFNKDTGMPLGGAAQPPPVAPAQPPVPPWAESSNDQYDPPRAAAFWRERLMKASAQ